MNQDPDKSSILLESAVLYWHKSFVRFSLVAIRTMLLHTL